MSATPREPGPTGFRVGIGYDSHRLVEGRRLVLGGVEIPHERGLAGHSDADVLTHAVIDALLGAAGLGDLGSVFPSDEERWGDADSLELLRLVVGRLPGAVLSVDATVIAEQPRLDRHRAEMVRNLEQLVAGAVSVKATTNDGLGAIGRGEGIACVAVALIEV
jgi:2-C-methyl-D-erythritol 2,4-cyclodiphosphate synthase